MAQIKQQLIGEESARELLELQKTATPRLTWSEDSAHVGTKIITFGVRTNGHRNLVVELTARIHPLVNRTVLEYGLFRIDPIFRQQERIYQLAIDDPKFITHREKGKPNIYGSHELIGDSTIAVPQCNGISFSDGLGVFLNSINLTLDDGPIPDPFVLSLK
jgi:hypothetical protein